ncbi:unnamed protein product [Ambrosiozyma monospora]|uniref:tRNA pseudouridine(55) synthase n=1 Tax=Ambrosiozyma monospora TaxID=43982 RepID=A0A9W6YVX1_AMBMO|nr:unnamed protein product [Ambrosiozyma monospora]
MDGVFAINKPSGVSSANFLNRVNRIFSEASIFQASLKQNSRNYKRGKTYKKNPKVKMGHGGTLDPLASGVLIVGLGAGTKKLGGYTNGSVKVYETVALLGGSTTTGDCEGQLLTRTEVSHIDKSLMAATRDKFVGTLNQTPPIFSALKMDGKPLYEYARKGLPLPKQIKSREVKVYDFTLHDDCLSTEHDYKFLKPELDEDGSSLTDKLVNNPTLNDHTVPISNEYLEKAKSDPNLKTEIEPVRELVDSSKYESDEYRAPIAHFTSTVSSGTYIRSLISDYGRALGSSAYMVKLIRHKQAEWDLAKNCFQIEDFESNDESVWGPVLKKVLEKGNEVNVEEELKTLKEKWNQEHKDEKSEEPDAGDAKRRKVEEPKSEEPDAGDAKRRKVEEPKTEEGKKSDSGSVEVKSEDKTCPADV